MFGGPSSVQLVLSTARVVQVFLLYFKFLGCLAVLALGVARFGSAYVPAWEVAFLRRVLICEFPRWVVWKGKRGLRHGVMVRHNKTYQVTSRVTRIRGVIK
jgi:hypothetical protein